MEPDSARPHRFTVLSDAIWRSEYSIMTPRYSFIIPAYNEQAVIASTIDAIHQAAVSLEGAFEIIVVNDASTDCTAHIAREKGASVVDVHKRQIAAVRNAGAEVAVGEILVFVDADTLVTTSTLRELEHLLKDPRVVAGGARLEFDRPPPFGGLAARIFLFVYFAANLAAGGFLFARRDTFFRAGRFDERYFCAEEVYLSRALKRLGKFKIIKHPVITSARKFRMKNARDHMNLIKHLIRGGSRGWESREGLDMWYDGSRENGPKLPE
jgi:glycosyltransferase involved in cell wall biosynthesis